MLKVEALHYFQLKLYNSQSFYQDTSLQTTTNALQQLPQKKFFILVLYISVVLVFLCHPLY